METYYVFSDKGWWGKSSTYTSELEKAMTFSRQGAIEFCRKRTNPALTGALPFIPVSGTDIDEVLK